MKFHSRRSYLDSNYANYAFRFTKNELDLYRDDLLS